MSTSTHPSLLLSCLIAFAAHAQALVPPSVVESVPASYPLRALAAHQEGTSVLRVTIGAQGQVVNAEVARSGGELFDHAALEAITRWRFKPGTRDGKPAAMRVEIPFHFQLTPEQTESTTQEEVGARAASQASGASEAASPGATASDSSRTAEGTTQALASPRAATTDSGTQAPATSSPTFASGAPSEATQDPPPALDAGTPVFSTTVRSRREGPPRASSDFVLDRAVLTVAPHRSTADLLGTAPGVYVSSPEGDAVGHEIYLRGFNAEHGQDIELSVGPLPVNQPSHIHGQGYSDLGFILPEAVHSVRVTEGVYDPRQGDFAVAGSVHFDLGVSERGILSKTSFGSFGQFRQLLLWAPKDEPEETFAAVSFQRTDGFGTNRGGQSGTALGQLAFTGPLGAKGLLLLGAHGARANLAGVLRRDDVQEGRVDFYGIYTSDPAAASQSAFNSRYVAAVTLEKLADSGAKTTASLWTQLIDFRGRFDFTGYLERSRQNPEWVGKGDLTEQSNQDTGFGLSLVHRPTRVRFNDWANAGFELGATARTNGIEQKQFLLKAPQNETWDIRTDATVRTSDLGAYVDVDAQLGRFIHLRGGFRANVLFANVDDRLGNFIPSYQKETHIIGYRRSALGLAAGPRATLEVGPWSWLQLLASYGEGYRSPQALQLEEGENAPYAKVRALEAGVRLKSERSSLTAAAYRTTLSADLAFDPGEASLTRIGPTQRQGAALHVLTRPWEWLIGSFSATYVHATLTAPPTSTPDNPNPPFQAGQLLPYVPPLVLRGDLGTEQSIPVAGAPLKLRVGAGGHYLSSRPLPYSQFADPFFLLDASASARWRWVELSLEVFNLLNSRYAASEYSFVSDWNNREAPSLIPARHFAAGAPRSLVASLSLHF